MFKRCCILVLAMWCGVLPSVFAAQIEIEVTLRDLSINHPDMQAYIGYETGMVKDKLGRDGKPVLRGNATKITSAQTFYDWYNDTDANQSMKYTLVLDNGKAPDDKSGVFVFADSDFFPLNGLLGNESYYRGNNYYFTLEMRTEFTYVRGQEFSFRGDDDLWVFIDGNLVIDIGGVHGPIEKSVNLDTLGLTEGETYTLDLFFAERRQIGSNFKISTSIANLITAPDPDQIAEYRFEEENPGSHKNILDSSGNGNHAMSMGNLDFYKPINNRACRAMVIPENTNTSTPDYLITDIDIKEDIGYTGSISFWYKPNDKWQGGRIRTLFSSLRSPSDASNRSFALNLLQNGSLRFGFEDNNYNESTVTTSPLRFDTREWKHITVTYSVITGNAKIYIDGQLQSTQHQFNASMWKGNNMPNYGELTIGDDFRSNSSNDYSADGIFDDIRVYNFEQSPEQISDDIETAAPCSVIYGFSIEHPSQTMTCEVADVRVKACVDEACTELYDRPLEIDMSPAPDNASGSITFVGQVALTYSSTEETTHHYRVSPVNFAFPENLNNSCDNGCRNEFVNASLQFMLDGRTNRSDTASVAGPITAGQSMSSLSLRAVKDNNGVCVPHLQGQQDIDLQYSCLYKDGSAGKACAVGLNGEPVGAGLGDISTRVSLNFNSSGVANFANYQFPDAIDVRFKAASNIDDVVMTSNDALIEFNPKRIAVTTEQLTPNTHTAGLPFSVKITGYGYNNIRLPSYQADQLRITASRVSPTLSGQYGNLHLNDTLSVSVDPNVSVNVNHTAKLGAELAFEQGQYVFNNAYYDEVGSFSVQVEDTQTYQVITSNALSVGRFIPAYFDVVKNYQPQLTQLNGNPFTYLQQQFDFALATQPRVTLTAYNALGEITTNYAKESWRYTVPSAPYTNAQIALSDQSASGLGVAYVGTPPLPNIIGKDSADGKGELLFNDITLAYNKPVTPLSPFDTEVQFALSADFLRDADGVCYQTSYPDGCQSFNIENIMGTEQRYGRLELINAFGPEDKALRVPVQTEYFTATGWALSVDDNATPIAMNMALSHILMTHGPSSDNNIVATLGVPSLTGTVINGKSSSTDFMLMSPFLPGYVDIRLNPNAGLEWSNYLLIDRDGDGDIDADDAPSASATFGIFNPMGSRGRLNNYREQME